MGSDGCEVPSVIELNSGVNAEETKVKPEKKEATSIKETIEEVKLLITNFLLRGALAAIIIIVKQIMWFLIGWGLGDDLSVTTFQLLNGLSAFFFIGVAVLITMEGLLILALYFTKAMIDEAKLVWGNSIIRRNSENGERQKTD